MTPKRIQLSRTKGYKMPSNTIKVDRSTRWGNPFNATQIGLCYPQKGLPMPIVPLATEPSLERCLDMYKAYLWGVLANDPEFLDPLKGKNLGCLCKEGELCHADVLLRLANDWGDE